MVNRVEQEIAQFLGWKEKFPATQVKSLDSYGFMLRSTSKPSERMDVLFTALIHGDEVVGLETLNLLLADLHLRPAALNLGFILCNVDAARANVRFIETDLNRCFALDRPRVTGEERRAAQIEAVVAQADFVFDLHQTVEPTVEPFFIFQHRKELVHFAHGLLPDVPIVTFPDEGFSLSGKTVVEYSSLVGGHALTLECGQKGFSRVIAEDTLKACRALIAQLTKSKAAPVPKGAVEVIFLCDIIRRTPGAKLLPGFINGMKVTKGQKLGDTDAGPLLSSVDGFLYFPKYGELAARSAELCELGIKKMIG